MLAGLLGMVIPLFPGITVIWLAALGLGMIRGFSTVGIVLFVLLTLLMIGGNVVDNLLMGAGARKGGAGWVTVIVSLVAGVLFTLIFPPFGGLIAAPLSVFLLEYYRLRDWRLARQATFGLAAGWGASFFARLLIGCFMLILALVWVWLG
jgi:uncharacterized protein YqgC (DUF456 family)